MVAACLLEWPPQCLGRNHTNHMIGTTFRLPVGAGDQDTTYVLDWPSSTQTCGTTVLKSKSGKVRQTDCRAEI